MRFARAVAGSAATTLRIAGATGAKNFVTITAPMMRGPDSGRSLVLLKLIKNGAMVKPGDVVAEIDSQSIRDHVDDINAQVVQADADVRKRKAEQLIEMENLQQNLRLASSTVQKSKLDAQASAIRSDIDKEELKLAVDEADASLRNAQTELAITRQKQASEIRILEYTRERHTRHRDRHKHDVTLFTIHAPIAGLAVMQSIWRGGDMGQVQEGDQVSPGQPFVKIVDPKSMQLEAAMNQSESEGVAIGQPAEIHLDAFPGLTLHGKVASIGAMGVGGWREQQYIRTLPVRVSIADQDPRVIPDLSGSANVSLSSSATGTLVPVEAVRREDGKPFVYVRNGAETQRRSIDLALRTNTHAVVRNGLKPGEEVVLNR